MRNTFLLLILTMALSCKESKEQEVQTSDFKAIESKDIADFKVLDSKFITNKEIWEALENELLDFTEAKYNTMKSLVLEKDISTLQQYVAKGKLTYEALVKFYLFRIRKFDRENEMSLNSVISINPKVVAEARACDAKLKNTGYRHPIFGMPVLLKDNINTEGMPTTAGAVALKENMAKDAFIVERLKVNGALILGKTNLSEWAYFFCGECPSGYSAIGGQTLNPYGRRTMDTGGSSSGSGVAVSANFCTVAVGTETAGSILSPASQNSVVGLKPTIGLLSRSGIVPISGTLDTAGPMTKTVRDNIILMDALFGYDDNDEKSIDTQLSNGYYFKNSYEGNLKERRLGAFKSLKEDTLYVNALEELRKEGATIVEIEDLETELPDFIKLLNLDMKKDLPAYLKNHAGALVQVKSVQDVITFNKTDSLNVMPYGQALFGGIVEDESTEEKLESIKKTLKENGKQFFDAPMEEYDLDGVLSINNYHAAYAAVAEYPAITIPMGYTGEGEPKGLTIISKPLSERMLLEMAIQYEQASKKRIPPANYQ